jgi:imidazolonepropionase-like amidohydrolase
VPRRTGRRGSWGLAALIAAAALAGCGGDEQADLLVTAPRLFDGEQLIRDGAVAIRADEIVAAGSREDVDVDAERTIALRDATLLPGLIDLHTHGLGFGQARSAVTTVRDLGTDDRNLPLQGASPGPRVIAAGPLITAPGGYPIPIHGPNVAHVVRSPAGARAYVRSLADRGAGVIKVSLQFGFPVLTFATLRAIVEEAHEHDLRVTAHVGEGRGARLALRAGVEELAHMPCGEDPQLMGELAAAGMEIVATLHVIQLGFGCPGLPENATTFARRGGVLLYGSDYGVRGIPRGVDVTELDLLSEVGGLGPLGALRAATSEAAQVLGIDGLGRLAEGSPADVVAVPGDPLQDLDVLSEPVLVVRGGEIQVGG